MTLHEEYRRIIIGDLNKAIEMAKTVEYPEDKMYFFSISFASIQRIINLQYNQTLVFVHQILQSTHQSIMQRLATRSHLVSQGTPESFIELPFIYLNNLLQAISENSENRIWSVLEEFSQLWYATSGNGFYLFLDGKMNLDK